MSTSEKLPSGVAYSPQYLIAPDEKGQLLTSNGITTDLLDIGVNDQVLIADDSKSEGLKWASSLSVIGTVLKADIVTGDGTDPAIFSGAPENDHILVADDSKSEGLKWIYPLTKTWTFYHAVTNANVPSVGAGASWQTRPINTVQVTNADITTITLASNQLTITELGKYDVTSSQYYHAVEEFQLRLRNITSGTTYVGSTITGYVLAAFNPVIICTIDIIVVPTIIEFQYNCEISIGDGLGRNATLLTGKEPLNTYASFSLTRAS